MTDETTARDRAHLADAEAWWRAYAADDLKVGWRGRAVLLAEYDRRGGVERAAAAYVMAGLCGNDRADQSAKLTALVEAVRTNGEFRG